MTLNINHVANNKANINRNCVVKKILYNNTGASFGVQFSRFLSGPSLSRNDLIYPLASHGSNCRFINLHLTLLDFDFFNIFLLFNKKH